MSARRIDGYGVIDRSQPLNFAFDGKSYQGVAGDTLASALVANGVRIMGRSFKYHRPRGLWGAWVDEPNAIMNVNGEGVQLPNCLATTTYLQDGMEARAVNAWPSAARDLKGGLDLFHRWLGAGFYYKTFMWPDWHLFEPAIRKMAGLGTVSPDVLDGYEADQVFDHCDVLVVGGGAAGLVAARTAAEAGQNVCLVDDQQTLGGSLYQLPDIDGRSPVEWVATQREAIVNAGARILTKTTAFGVYDHGLIGLIQSGSFGDAPRLIRMRAGRVIMATGALDRPMTFPENDRPGVMSLSGAAELLARYGVLVGHRLAVLATHSLAEASIKLLRDAGVEIERIDPADGAFTAFGGRASTGLKQSGRARTYDAVLTSGGKTPLVHLWRHAGGKLDWCDTRQAFVPGKAPDMMTAVGAANGTFDLEGAFNEARAAGAGHATMRADTQYTVKPHWPEPGSKGRQWIDFQHDVTLKDIEVAARENYVSVEHLKRFTTLGMASDQGKTSNMAGLAAMATIQGRPIPEVGTTTFRPPFVPVPLEIYRGAHREQNWHPIKRLPLETTHRALDAALGEYGGWLRPAWYGTGTSSDLIAQEVQAARESAGLFDGSPLGKIEVMGPDAEAFLNFIYYNTIRTMKPGQLRYGFMLTESGTVFDDGVLARLGPDHFIVSCSSSHVDGVRMHLEAWRQDGNDPDRIFIHDATQHWATVAVTGPEARDVLMTLGLDIDLSAEAFKHMSLQSTTWRGAALRIARVSFSGDLSFEVSIRASKATELWDSLHHAGAPLGLRPIGLEAMSIMRAEKGYLIIGKDTDGETMPHDLGFSAPRDKKTAAFVGDRSLHCEKANDAARKQLVGLMSDDRFLPTGAHLVKDDTSQGYVTSSYQSPTLGRPIALALVTSGQSRIGETIAVQHLGKTQKATICAPCFLDPKGERLNA
ncbi:2Fe-2S iron-sulfur cluster-binding protein [Cognatishimia sp.]|uniref:2Fe-2S iron-sulfur cluster-binding protein n=1 Tax=Cognatishimia sp. TaxID=2211648 RepID=UPI00351777BE